jgi:CRP/FNR family cyclic AMP-dependent transcriptional regulator
MQESRSSLDPAMAGILLAESGDLIGRPQSFIERLPPHDRECVRRIGTTRQIARSAVLFSQGQDQDGIFVVESGLIRSFYTAPSGRQITLAYWHPGNFVGGPHLFGGVCMWGAIAARKSVVTYFPATALRALAREVPDLALELIDALAFKARCYSSLAQMLGTRSLHERLIHVLMHFATTHGIAERDGQIAVAVAFSHAEIANLIGSTRQWVTISLNRLQKRGIISQRRGMMIIRQPDVLRDLNEQDDRVNSAQEASLPLIARRARAR